MQNPAFISAHLQTKHAVQRNYRDAVVHLGNICIRHLLSSSGSSRFRFSRPELQVSKAASNSPWTIMSSAAESNMWKSCDEEQEDGGGGLRLSERRLITPERASNQRGITTIKEFYAIKPNCTAKTSETSQLCGAFCVRLFTN